MMEDVLVVVQDNVVVVPMIALKIVVLDVPSIVVVLSV